MDETYVTVRGSWVYLYRAVDKAGWTVDFFLSRNRDGNAAKTFLRNAMKNRRTPTKITLDAYAASHRAVREMKENGELPRRVKVRFALSAAEDVEAKIVAAHDPVLAFNNERDALITAQTLRSLRDPAAWVA